MDVIWSLFGFVLVMGLIVTIHEWGHYQVARWFNIKVTTFSIGFGKTLYEKQGSETTFKIGLIPLGGYVKFVDEREGNVPAEDLPRAFNRQSVYKRFAVVLAGPVINLIFAWFVFTLMYLIGVSGYKPVFSQVADKSSLQQALPDSFIASDEVWSVAYVNDDATYNWQMVHQSLLKSLVNQDQSVDLLIENVFTDQVFPLDNVSLHALDLDKPDQNWLKILGFIPFKASLPAVLGQVVSGGPAALAGLKPQDKVLSIGGVPILQWSDLVEIVQAIPDQQVEIEYQRQGVIYVALIEVGHSEAKGGAKTVGKIGVGVDIALGAMKPFVSTVQFGFIESMDQAYKKTVDLVDMSLVMLKRMLFGEVSLQNLSGPLSIAQFSGQAVQTGLIAFLGLLGLLSLSIGILNLLPIPVLDGGHLVYYLVEMVKGSPVSEQVVGAGQKLGLVLIVGLTFVALFNDVLRISNG
ncbi:MAG: regulator of sigma E protease [Thiomicrorhabdus sp.]|nr:MAG: regulator of sigma E protease [Thiomicrorhabdus sp.]